MILGKIQKIFRDLMARYFLSAEEKNLTSFSERPPQPKNKVAGGDRKQKSPNITLNTKKSFGCFNHSKQTLKNNRCGKKNFQFHVVKF